MRYLKVVCGVSLAASAVVFSGCATQSEPPKEEAPVVVAPPAPPTVAPVAPPKKVAPVAGVSSARTMDAYKKDVAQRIVNKNNSAIADTLPPILKSVVVLDITVDETGTPVHVAVRRSNGYKDLEQAAITSVKRAGPFPAPSADVLKGGTSVSYTETWLFRPDGRYQVRSVADVQPGATSGSVATTKKK
jgi:periplasmic protein TonB